MESYIGKKYYLKNDMCFSAPWNLVKGEVLVCHQVDEVLGELRAYLYSAKLNFYGWFQFHHLKEAVCDCIIAVARGSGSVCEECKESFLIEQENKGLVYNIFLKMWE